MNITTVILKLFRDPVQISNKGVPKLVRHDVSLETDRL